jgi:hypothetical protein
MKKVLFATIVPFWNRETGAQQRIFSLVKVLESHGHQVRVFYPTHAGPSDKEAVQALGLDVAFERSDKPPAAQQSVLKKIKWQIEAVKHAVTGGRAAENSNGPLRLTDFRWPWAEAAFEHAVIEFAADVIVCEYITMAYLVASLPAALRSNVHCLVDTHDLLSRRQEAFAAHDRQHWIHVSAQEEAAALNLFDTIVAIQEDEAATLKTMAPEKDVIVVGHQAMITDAVGKTTQKDSDRLVMGYLGSGNASNVDAVNEFLDVVWRKFENDPRVGLVLAGNASNTVPSNLRFKNVKLLGRISAVNDFYAQVDAVINPVGYGTGLKIKSVEAIAYEKPLLCTTAGWHGQPDRGVIVVNQLPEMTDVINKWLQHPDSFEELCRVVSSGARSSTDSVYGRLLELL